MNYLISQEALQDLENIWLYTYENWSLEQADRYYNLIMDEIEYLADHPKSGNDYGDVIKGYFRSRVKSHFIFYKTRKNIKGIEVVRILHQNMDINFRLNQ